MKLFSQPASSRPVLILGAGARSGKIYREFVEPQSQSLCCIKGFIPLAEIDSVIPESLLLRNTDTLLTLARRLKIKEIVIVKDRPDQVCPVQQLLDCKLAGLQLGSLESFLKSLPEESQQNDGNIQSLLAACVNFRWH